MTVYLELVADDVDDIAGWIGAAIGSSNAQVELLPDGDLYVNLDLRVKVVEVNDETGEGHPRPLIEVFADLPEPDADELFD
jgi:hypothetical protein